MTHNHSRSKTLQRQLIRRREMTRSYEPTLRIDKVSLPVDDSGIVVVHYRRSELLKRIGRVKSIARIEKYQIISPRHCHCLIHRIIYALVGT